MNPYEEDLQNRERELRNSAKEQGPIFEDSAKTRGPILTPEKSRGPILEETAKSSGPIFSESVKEEGPDLSGDSPILSRGAGEEGALRPYSPLEKEEIQTQGIKDLIAANIVANPDERARAMAIGEHLKIDPEIVYKNMDQWEALLTQQNPAIDDFLRDPKVRKLVVDNPALVPMVPTIVGDSTWDYMKGWLRHKFNSIPYFFTSHHPAITGGWLGLGTPLKEKSPEELDEMDKDWLKILEQHEEDARESKYYVRPKTVLVQKNGQVTSITQDWRLNQMQNEYASLGLRALDAVRNGGDVDAYIWQAARLKQQMSGLTPSGGIVTDIMQAVNSTVYGAWTGVKIGSVGMVAGTLAGVALKRHPGTALAWGMAASKTGFGLGAFFGSYELEAGSTFLDLYGRKTPDGKFIDAETAAGHAVVYGLAAGLVEVVALKSVMDSLPWRKITGEVLKARAEGLAVKPLWEILGKDTYTASLKEWGRSSLKGGFKSAMSEGFEESTQAAMQYWATVSAMERAETGEGFGGKYFKTNEIVSAATDSFIPGAIGGGFLHGVGSTVNLATTMLATAANKTRSQEAARIIAHMNSEEGKPGLVEVARVVGGPVAHVIRKILEDKSGFNSDKVYITATEFEKLAGVQGSTLAVKLLGANGPKILAEALGGNNGGFIEVPLMDYLTKWVEANPKVARALANHTTLDPSYKTKAQLDAAEKADAKKIEDDIKESVARSKLIEEDLKRRQEQKTTPETSAAVTPAQTPMAGTTESIKLSPIPAVTENTFLPSPFDKSSLIELRLAEVREQLVKYAQQSRKDLAALAAVGIGNKTTEFHQNTKLPDDFADVVVELLRRFIYATAVRAKVDPDAVMTKFIPDFAAMTKQDFLDYDYPSAINPDKTKIWMPKESFPMWVQEFFIRIGIGGISMGEAMGPDFQKFLIEDPILTLEQKAQLAVPTFVGSLGDRDVRYDVNTPAPPTMSAGHGMHGESLHTMHWRHAVGKMFLQKLNPTIAGADAIFHELTHYFVNVYTELANDPRADPAIKADVAALKAWAESWFPSNPNDFVNTKWNKLPLGSKITVRTPGAGDVTGILIAHGAGDYYKVLFVDPVRGTATADRLVPKSEVVSVDPTMPPFIFSAKQQELLATTAEAYFLMGTAPSVALAGVFSRYRRAATAMYQFVAPPGKDRRYGPVYLALNPTNKRLASGYAVQLDPTVVTLFERWLAIDQEIDRALTWRTINPPYKTFQEYSDANPGAQQQDWEDYLKQAAQWYDKARYEAEGKVLKEAAQLTKALNDELLRKYTEDELARIKATGTYKLFDALANGVTRSKVGVFFPKLRRTEFLRDIAPNLTPEQMTTWERYLTDDVKGSTFAGLKMNILGNVSAQVDMTALTDALFMSTVPGLTKESYWSELAVENARNLFLNNHPRFSELFNELETAAQDATHNNIGNDWAIQELAMIAQPNRSETEGEPVRPVAPPGWKAATKVALRDAARKLMSETPLNLLDSKRILTRERHAAQMAYEALQAGDKETAAMWKQQQIFEMFCYEYSMQIRKDKLGFRDLLNKMFGRERAEILAKSGEINANFIQGIKEFFGETKTAGAIDRTEATKKFVNSLVEKLLGAAFDVDALVKTLETPKAWDDITPTEMYNVMRAVKQAWTVASKEHKLLLKGKEADLQAIVTNIALDATAQPFQPTEAMKDSGVPKVIWNIRQFLSGIEAARMDPESIISLLGKTATEVLWNRFIDARNHEAAISKRIRAAWAKTYDSMPKEMMARRDEGVDTSMLPMGSQAVRDRKWLWMVMLNCGNELNLKRLLYGRGEGLTWSQEKLDEFFKKNNVTDQEWEFVQGIWSMFEEDLWPDIQATYKAQHGVEPLSSKPRSFTYNGKTYKGGYFPLRYIKDTPASLDIKTRWVDSVRGLETIYKAQPVHDMMTAGFTEERVPDYKNVVDLNWDVFSGHVVSVIHYVAFDSMLRDSYKLLNDALFRQTVKERLGPRYLENIDSWLMAVGLNNSESVDEALRSFKEGLGWARSSLMISTLGFNVSVAAGDLTGPLYAVARGVEAGGIRLDYLFGSYLQLSKNIGRAFDMVTRGDSDIETIRQRAERLSKEVLIRAERVRHSLNRDLRRVAHEPRHLPTRVRAMIQEHAFFFMEFTDKYVTTMVWDAAFRRNIDMGMSQEDAVRDADSRVRGILPSHSTAEMPAFLRSRYMIGSLVAFFSFFNKMHNGNKQIWRRAYQDWGHLTGRYGDEDNPEPGSKAWNKMVKTGRFAASSARAMGHTLATYAVTSVFGEFLAGRGKEEDEEAWQWWTRKMLAAPALNVPFFGQGIEQIVNRVVTGKVRQMNIRVAPALAIFEKGIDLYAAFANREEVPTDAWIAGLEIAGSAAGIPTRQFVKTERYIRHEAEGEIESRGVGDYLGGLVYGQFNTQASNPFRIWHDISQ